MSLAAVSSCPQSRKLVHIFISLCALMFAEDHGCYYEVNLDNPEFCQICCSFPDFLDHPSSKTSTKREPRGLILLLAKILLLFCVPFPRILLSGWLLSITATFFYISHITDFHTHRSQDTGSFCAKIIMQSYVRR